MKKIAVIDEHRPIHAYYYKVDYSTYVGNLDIHYYESLC